MRVSDDIFESVDICDFRGTGSLARHYKAVSDFAQRVSCYGPGDDDEDVDEFDWDADDTEYDKYLDSEDDEWDSYY